MKWSILYVEKIAKYKVFTLLTSCSGQCAPALSNKLHPCSVNY